jgi:hypothetical protein
MKTTINEGRFPNTMNGVCDGSVAGTRFYNNDTGEELVLPGITVQQEGMSEVRIRFASHYGIASFVMSKGDTFSVNETP